MPASPKKNKKKERKSKKEDTKKGSTKTRSRKTAQNDSRPPPEKESTPATQAQADDPRPSADFEAGLLFARFARNGGVDAKDFHRMWREREAGKTVMGGDANPRGGAGAEATGGSMGPDTTFEVREKPGAPSYGVLEVGQLFQNFDAAGDGRLRRADFERLMASVIEKGKDKGQGEQATPGRVADETGVGDVRAGEGARGGGENESRVQQTVGGDTTRTGQESGVVVKPRQPVPTHYNETTGVPLPREAVASQASLGHTVVPINEAYNRRLSRLQALSSSSLMPVREQLLQLRRRLYTRIDEVKAAKAAVERETLADANAIVERLRSAEALKQAALSQRVGDVTTELDAVERIAEQVSGVSSFSETNGFATASARHAREFESCSKMVELIQAYPELCASIDRAASKAIDNAIDVRPDDFANETAERLEVVRRADRYEKALTVKDQILWTLMQEARELEDRCSAEQQLGEEYAEEAQEWVALAGKLSGEVVELRGQAGLLPELRKANTSLSEENRGMNKKIKDLEFQLAQALRGGGGGGARALRGATHETPLHPDLGRTGGWRMEVG